MVDLAAHEDRKAPRHARFRQTVDVEVVQLLLVQRSEQLVAAHRGERMVELADFRRAILESFPDAGGTLGVFGAETVEIREHVRAARELYRAKELVVGNQLDMRTELAGPAVQIRLHRETVLVV